MTKDFLGGQMSATNRVLRLVNKHILEAKNRDAVNTNSVPQIHNGGRLKALQRVKDSLEADLKLLKATIKIS